MIPILPQQQQQQQHEIITYITQEQYTTTNKTKEKAYCFASPGAQWGFRQSTTAVAQDWLRSPGTTPSPPAYSPAKDKKTLKNTASKVEVEIKSSKLKTKKKSNNKKEKSDK